MLIHSVSLMTGNCVEITERDVDDTVVKFCIEFIQNSIRKNKSLALTMLDLPQYSAECVEEDEILTVTVYKTQLLLTIW